MVWVGDLELEGSTHRPARFVVKGLIGRGGMADVRLAEELQPDGSRRPCVLKLIAPEYADDREYREMFLEEARISRLLQHPNIVRALDTGEIEGLPYIAFELVRGVSWAAILARSSSGPPPVTAVVELGLALCGALAYAHALALPDGVPLNLVHRDVTPDNVLVTASGRVKLLDFGIARFAGRTYETQPGDLKGKLRYMSPEQLEGHQELDARADIFSLGVVLAESLGLLEKKLSLGLKGMVSAHAGGVHPELHDLLLRMNASSPSERPQSAKEVWRALTIIRRELGAGPTLSQLARTVPNPYEGDGEGEGEDELDEEDEPTDATDTDLAALVRAMEELDVLATPTLLEGDETLPAPPPAPAPAPAIEDPTLQRVPRPAAPPAPRAMSQAWIFWPLMSAWLIALVAALYFFMTIEV